MAITSNGLGKFSGKLGGAVFVIRNGKQIVREYNPRPSNPKSALQLKQRAKGNLAGRISSFVPKAAISGLGVNNIRRRSRFNQLILKGAQVSLIGNDYSAKIPWESVKFSEGTVIQPYTLVSISPSENFVAIALRGVLKDIIPIEDYASMNARLVAMIYDTSSQNLVEVATKVATKPNQGGDTITRISVAHPTGYTVAVFLIPFSSADGTAVSIASGLVGKSDEEIAASLSVNDNAVTFEYGNSVFLGQGTFTPSSTSAAPSKERKKE